MQTGFTEDQNQFREVVDRFLQEKSKPTATRKLIETESGYDQEVWQQMSGEVGLVGTHIPEAYGGFGFGPIELGITQEEMGRHLYTGPFFASAVMASYALLHMGDEDARLEYLPEIAAGTTIATFALDSLAPAYRYLRLFDNGEIDTAVVRVAQSARTTSQAPRS